MNPRPNILFIITDDHRHQAISGFGDRAVQTPNLDSLINQGASFTQNRILGGLLPAVCVPTRGAILSGCHPYTTSGTQADWDYQQAQCIQEHLTTLPQAFRNANYHCHLVGKWHNDKASAHRSFDSGSKIFFGGMSGQFSVPVNDFDPTGEFPEELTYTPKKHSTELFGDAAIDFIKQHDEEKPFFMYLAFTSPHDPRDSPEPYASMYDPKNMPLPENFAAEHPFDNGELEIRDEQLAAMPRTENEIKKHIADYYGMITHHDAKIGQIIQTLKDQGLFENTLIVYTADHGLSIGQHGLMGKQNLYDHSLRAPLIIRGPGVPANWSTQALTHTFDVYPTLCQLADIPAPTSIQDAQSLTPLLNDQTQQHRTYQGSLYRHNQRAITDGQWKLIRYYPSDDKPIEPRVQLFDLANDPLECHDLANEANHEAIKETLAHELTQWLKKYEDPLSHVPVLV